MASGRQKNTGTRNYANKKAINTGQTVYSKIGIIIKILLKRAKLGIKESWKEAKVILGLKKPGKPNLRHMIRYSIQQMIRFGKFIRTPSNYIVKGPLNYSLLLAIIFLNIYGMIMMYSASYYSAGNMELDTYHFLINQFKYVMLGMAGMWIASRIDYHVWVKFGWTAFVLSIGLILLLKTPLGYGALGAVRWIQLGPIRFQAAEPVKLFMIIFFAKFISWYGLENGCLQLLAWVSAVLIAGLIAAISDNVSTALIVLGVCYMIFVTRQKQWVRYVVLLVIAVIFVVGLVLWIEFGLEPMDNENFRIRRIRAFIHPEQYVAKEGQQPMQALYAIGSGGFWGKGLGQSLVKFKLSEPYNDYILAILCEEMGVFGACLLLFLFGYLLVQLIKIERIASDIEGKIICVGVFAQIAIQTILNVMVVVSWFPTTGVSLPFISYGGASAIFLLLELGVVFNVDNYAKNKRYRKEAIKTVDELELKRLKEKQLK